MLAPVLLCVAACAANQGRRPACLRQPWQQRDGSGGGGRLPPFSPALPAQYPRTFDVQNFTQPVDHFNLLQPVDPTTRHRRTFTQRLLFHNDSWGGPGHPVIFYTGLSVLDARIHKTLPAEPPDWVLPFSASGISQRMRLHVPPAWAPLYDEIELNVPRSKAGGSRPDPHARELFTDPRMETIKIYRLIK